MQIVLLSVSDHYTRNQQQNALDKLQPPSSSSTESQPNDVESYTSTVGVILGTQSDKEIHINFASDLKLISNKNDSGKSPWRIEKEYLEKQVRLSMYCIKESRIDIL